MVLEKFLCCYELETGGKLLGRFGIRFFAIQLLGALYLAIFSDEGLEAYEERRGRQYGVSNDGGYKMPVETFRTIAVVCAVFSFLKVLVSISLWKGTKTRDHKKVKYYLIFDAIFYILYLIFVMFNPFLIVTILFLIFPFYLTMCIYALYKKFENESKQGLVTHVNSSYGKLQNDPQQPQGYQQPQAYYQPQGYPPQPQTLEQTIKFEDASGLPSYDFVVPS